MAPLQIKLGDDPRVIPLPSEPITVGRASQNAIAILDASLSRVHCELRRVDGTILVKDMGSRNGTLVNGSAVKEAKISGGDRIDVGICRILVLAEQGDFKLEISVGKGASAAPRTDSSDTRRLKEAAQTIENLPRTSSGKGDTVGWGKRSGGSAGLVAGVVFLALVVVVGIAVVKSRKKAGAVVVTEPWRGFDYAVAADYSKDWRTAPGSPTTLALAPGREGNGLEVARKPGERGLGEAWGPRMAVEPRKAYRLSAWAKAAGGTAGLRVGWCRTAEDSPFSWSGTGLSAEGGDVGGTWPVPEGAAFAQIACVVAGDAPRAVFDDVDFAVAALADRPPVAGRTVRAVFEAPGVFYFAARESAWIPAVVGIEGADASCSIDARRTAAGGTYGIPNPSGSATAFTVEEERDSEGEGFLLHFKTKGSGALLFLATPEATVDGHPIAESVRTGRAVVGKAGGRVAIEMRPDAEIDVTEGRVVVHFPKDEFEIAFLPEGAGKVQAGLEEAAKAEAAKQYGKALALYDSVVEKNPKGELGAAASERAEAIRGVADAALGRARDRRCDAEFSGKSAECDEAVKEYLSVEADFDGTEYAAQARAERESTEELRKQIASEMADSEVGRLLAAAESYLNEGRLALARAFCEAVQDRTSDPDASSRADSLLQRIESKEHDR
ncbi:MAG: FHA domain-containing protein [Planctomycetes bacterium]|nr:FHA domain-containing protein [Planctomycetota bacterium]